MYKTLGLDEKAYQLLKAAKRPGESFSDVVRRLLQPTGSWRDLVGLLGETQGKRMGNWLADHRKGQRQRTRKRLEGGP